MMQAVAPQKENPQARDEIDRVSSRVQAVACFFPPTDFLNYGSAGASIRKHPGINALQLAGPFDYHELSATTHMFERVTDDKRIKEIETYLSPVYSVSKDSAPALIIHGDADTIVPYQQAQIMIEAYNKAGVPAKLITRPGANHGWATLGEDTKLLADWFDQYLAPKTK